MLVILLTTCGLVLLSVGVHYNALVLYSRFLQKPGHNVRRWVRQASSACCWLM